MDDGVFKPTYMHNKCDDIFLYNNSENAVGFIQDLCTEWFQNAMERCSEMIFFNPPHKNWFLSLLQQLISYQSNFDEKSLGLPKNQYLPEYLTRPECDTMFVQMAKDYIYVAPKYRECLEENLHYVTFLKTVFALFALFIMQHLLKKIRNRNRSNAMNADLSNGPTKSEEKLACQLNWLNNRSLAIQKYETNHLKVHRNNPDKLLTELPLIAIRLKKKSLAEALVTLIHSDPTVDELHGGVLSENLIRSKEYAMQKMKHFLSNGTFCFVTIIDTDFNEDDSDTDPVTSNVQDDFSTGDQPNRLRCPESTVDESPETSSANSEKCLYSSRPKRYTVRYSTPSKTSIGKSEKGVKSTPRTDSLNRPEHYNRTASKSLIRKPTSYSQADLSYNPSKMWRS